MVVTLYSDGGLSTKTGQAIAFYCGSNDGVIKGSRHIGHHFDDIMQVEAYAVYSAIKKVMAVWENITQINIRIDAKSLCYLLNSGKASKNKRLNTILNEIKNFGVALKAIHVKGHQNIKNNRCYFNTWCDKELNRIRTKSFKNKGQGLK